MRARWQRLSVGWRTGVGAGVIVVAVAAGLAFYALSAVRSCTLIGGLDGVQLHLSDTDLDLEATVGERWRSVVGCVDGRCRTLGAEDQASFGVPLDVRDPGPRLVAVTLIRQAKNGELDVRSSRVRLERSEPNGPGCGTWWNASVRPADLTPSRDGYVGASR